MRDFYVPPPSSSVSLVSLSFSIFFRYLLSCTSTDINGLSLMCFIFIYDMKTLFRGVDHQKSVFRGYWFWTIYVDPLERDFNKFYEGFMTLRCRLSLRPQEKQEPTPVSYNKRKTVWCNRRSTRSDICSIRRVVKQRKKRKHINVLESSQNKRLCVLHTEQ